MQSLKQMLLTGYTAKETVWAYLVTGWFSFGAALAYETLVAQHLGANYLPELFYLILLSLLMLLVFPLSVVVYNGSNGIEALARHDFSQAAFSFGLMLVVFLVWYIIRYAMYGRPRRWTVPAP